MNLIMRLIKRIFSKKASKGIVKATNNAKHIEILFDGSWVELRGHFSETGRVGLLKVKYKRLLDNLEYNTHISIEGGGGISVYGADDEVRVCFPVLEELQKVDHDDLIIIKKSNFQEVLARP